MQIPIQMAVNAEEFNLQANLRDIKRLKKEGEQDVLPKVSLDACFTHLSQPEHLSDYFSVILNKHTSVRYACNYCRISKVFT